MSGELLIEKIAGVALAVAPTLLFYGALYLLTVRRWVRQYDLERGAMAHLHEWLPDLEEATTVLGPEAIPKVQALADRLWVWTESLQDAEAKLAYRRALRDYDRRLDFKRRCHEAFWPRESLESFRARKERERGESSPASSGRSCRPRRSHT